MQRSKEKIPIYLDGLVVGYCDQIALETVEMVSMPEKTEQCSYKISGFYPEKLQPIELEIGKFYVDKRNNCIFKVQTFYPHTEIEIYDPSIQMFSQSFYLRQIFLSEHCKPANEEQVNLFKRAKAFAICNRKPDEFRVGDRVSLPFSKEYGCGSYGYVKAVSDPYVCLDLDKANEVNAEGLFLKYDVFLIETAEERSEQG